MLTVSLQELVRNAIVNAHARGDQVITLERFCAELLRDGRFAEMIWQCGGDTEELASQLACHIDDAKHATCVANKDSLLKALLQSNEPERLIIRNVGGLPPDIQQWLETNDTAVNGRILLEVTELVNLVDKTIDSTAAGVDARPWLAADCERSFLRAFIQMAAAFQASVAEGDLLAAMLEEKDAHAVCLLNKQGVSRIDVLNNICHGISKRQGGIYKSIVRTTPPRFFDLLSRFKLVLHNDHYTPMQFVVTTLELEFAKSTMEATEMMLAVHRTNSVVVGEYPFSLAQRMAHKVVSLAQAAEFPLLMTVGK